MSWLRRLSRDRSSKTEQDFKMPIRPASYQNDSNNNQSVPFKDTQYSSSPTSQDKLQSYRPTTAQEQQYTNINSSYRSPGNTGDATMRTAPSNMAPTPDPLTKAFNDAIKPYVEQIDLLRAELEDSNLHAQQLEDERADMHAWIDKRGLRADVPPSIAQAMNTDPSSAQTLNYHLDRKMTVLNHDLHRLQDSLSSHLPTSTFATTLSTLLPSIETLASLPGGAPLAFELLIKLGGNLNSHGGDEGWNNDADAASRADFYARLDEAMVEVVRLRLGGNEVPGWNVGRDVKRLEKTGGFLRDKLGLMAYFPGGLELMRYEVKGVEQGGRVQRSP